MFITMLIFLTLVRPASGLTSSVEVVDSLGLDADRFPRISYRSKDPDVSGSLTYAVKTAAGTWIVEEWIPPATWGGRYTSLALGRRRASA
jgi:hypothetical protein